MGSLNLSYRLALMLEEYPSNFQDTARMLVNSDVICRHRDLGCDIVEMCAVELHDSVTSGHEPSDNAFPW